MPCNPKYLEAVDEPKRYCEGMAETASRLLGAINSRSTGDFGCTLNHVTIAALVEMPYRMSDGPVSNRTGL